MAHRVLTFALTLAAAASPVAASQPEPTPTMSAPAAGRDARYCMRVEPATGSRIETVQCWTRLEWAELGVDVDEDWAEEGVAVIA